MPINIIYEEPGIGNTYVGNLANEFRRGVYRIPKIIPVENSEQFFVLEPIADGGVALRAGQRTMAGAMRYMTDARVMLVRCQHLRRAEWDACLDCHS